MRNILTFSMMMIALTLAWLDWNYTRNLFSLNGFTHIYHSQQSQKEKNKIIISCETEPKHIDSKGINEESSVLLNRFTTGEFNETKHKINGSVSDSFVSIEKRCLLIRYDAIEQNFMVAPYPMNSSDKQINWQSLRLSEYMTANTKNSIWFHWLPANNPDREIRQLAKIIQEIGKERVSLSWHKNSSIINRDFIDEFLTPDKVVILFQQSSILYTLSKLKLLPFIFSPSHTIAIPINQNSKEFKNIDRLFSIQKQGYTVWLLPYGKEPFYRASEWNIK